MNGKGGKMLEDNQKQRSILFVEFEEYGSTNIKGLQVQSCSPIQLLAFSKYLEINSEQDLLQARAEAIRLQQQEKIITPQPQIIVPGR